MTLSSWFNKVKRWFKFGTKKVDEKINVRLIELDDEKSARFFMYLINEMKKQMIGAFCTIQSPCETHYVLKDELLVLKILNNYITDEEGVKDALLVCKYDKTTKTVVEDGENTFRLVKYCCVSVNTEEKIPLEEFQSVINKYGDWISIALESGGIKI